MTATAHVIARPSPQVAASDPAVSAFVSANAGSGKTSTLVSRVARLLLKGARPEAVLCVTYTKAAAAEMQRRLFKRLGDWAVMDDAALEAAMGEIGERPRDLGVARTLFARALETPGGIRITTIHACCERLLRRFPLEAGVSPQFEVLDETAAREASARAREDVALAALTAPEGSLGRAYAYFSVELDYRRFHDMFTEFEAQRRAIGAYVRACDEADGFGADVWRRCGFSAPEPSDEIERAAVAAIRWGQWGRAAEALLAGSEAGDAPRGRAMQAIGPWSSFADVWAVFSTDGGEPRKSVATKAVDAAARAWLEAEQRRLAAVCERLKAARIAEASVHALSLAIAYITLYEGKKDALGALDFGDLIERTRELITTRADAAWVLFKLDGGLDHVLLDEAQDTAPDQWDILRALSSEFFAGRGAGVADRTVFAVGDEKQSIFSFQGAAPERLAAEAQAFGELVRGADRTFRRIPLQASWRSTPEILSFVDAVFADAGAAAALRPEGGPAFPIRHVATRSGGGALDLWPLEAAEAAEEVDPWAPVDAKKGESANRKLARRIAASVKAMVARGEAVVDRRTGAPRPMAWGDVLILVRRRNALFHEIIRALKTAGAPVGGADRLLLSEHIAFQDLLALGRLARFADDDLTLAALLRSPFCQVDETSLYDLARGRERSLWSELQARAAERPAWSAAAEFLSWARREADTSAPFDFFARALARGDAAGASTKRRFLERLGREAEDAIDAFQAEVLAAERRGVIDLERLCAELALSEIEVVREHQDAEEAGEVRVMTAHGAKGLEAPVVILPDTTTRATPQGTPLLAVEGGGFLWAPRKAEDCPASAAARAARELACNNESLRLLYVALTRARDRLIIAGVETQAQYFRGSWREAIEAGFAHEAVEPLAHDAVGPDGGAIRRFGADPALLAERRGVAAPSEGRLPDWVRRAAPAEPAAQLSAAPSRLADADGGTAPSPLARANGLGRYRRGELIHRLLELLPDLPPAARADAASRLMALERDLDEAQRREMAAAALAVLDDPVFASVFGAGSRAEVALAGRVRGIAVAGRVDRLLVEPARVLVVDFKTNRPAPADIFAADPAYLAQVALYAALLSEVFPGRRVEAALIWTDGPKLMAVPENVIARALDGIAGSG